MMQYEYHHRFLLLHHRLQLDLQRQCHLHLPARHLVDPKQFEFSACHNLAPGYRRCEYHKETDHGLEHLVVRSLENSFN